MNKKVVDAIWNSMGSSMFAAVSFLLLICVTRVYGVAKAGSFGVAVTTAQLMYRIGIFAIRQYQITDLDSKFSFTVYFSTKILTSLLAFLVFGLYVIFDSTVQNEFWQFFWIFLFYQVLSMDDLYQNRFFQENRLDKSGISKCLVIGGYLLSFFILLVCNLKLDFILAVSFLVSLVISIVNCPRHIWCEMIFLLDRSVVSLIKMVFPAFISNFLFAFINGLPKYTVYYFCGHEESGYINNIFILLNVVELVSSFIYYPFIPDITRNLTENPRKVHKLIFKISVAIISFGCVIAILLGYAGSSVMKIIYHKDFTIYIFEMIYTVSVCGVLVALTALLYWIPVIMREQKQLILIFATGSVAALTGCVVGTLHFGIRGAVVGHSLAVGTMAILLMKFLWAIKRQKVNKVGFIRV